MRVKSNIANCKGNMKIGSWAKKVRRSESPRLLGRRHRADFNRVAVQFAFHRGLAGAQFFKGGERGLVLGIEGIDFSADHQGVLRSLLDTLAEASSVVALHHVFRSAHGVTDGASERLNFGRERNRNESRA